MAKIIGCCDVATGSSGFEIAARLLIVAAAVSSARLFHVIGPRCYITQGRRIELRLSGKDGEEVEQALPPRRAPDLFPAATAG